MKRRLGVAAILLLLSVLSLGRLAQRKSRGEHSGNTASEEQRDVSSSSLSNRVDYNRDIKPILSSSCYSCHGPDEGSREANLRLDVRAEAVASAIVPGNANASRLVAKISHADPRKRMPPREAKKPNLTAEQINLIRRWIDEGAPYQGHWSFVRPVRPLLPQVKNTAWVRNPVDAFILAEQEAHGMSPAPEADRRTLIRRLSLDVIGLPPSPEDVERFVNDPSPDAYEALVDRLLASPHYGERMAVAWLDLVRYADTEGYSVDDDRRVWLYRDFVINSFNRNTRFDLFTFQQLAGDLLPVSNPEYRIASGYNRILMSSAEGCAEPEERRARYAADRVRNVSSVWLGLTMGCAECHDHKFDPLTTKEFYQLAAFFADIEETAVGQQALTFFPQNEEQKRKLDEVQNRAGKLAGELQKKFLASGAERDKWEAKLKKDDYKGVPEDIRAFLRVEKAQRTSDQTINIERYYVKVAPGLAEISKQLEEAVVQRSAVEKETTATLVSTPQPARVVRVLPRGNWQDKSGEEVKPALPAALFPDRLPPEMQLSRLHLALWLVSEANPLTTRVLVNRLWKLAFGKGLVASVDDFGAQGALPTHPQLLDWLAVELRDRQWDIKAMLKMLLMSNTYRQASRADLAIEERDPVNTWLTRQNRFRIDAEFIRDNALAISGLLARDVGGPSVKPYQPDGYWADRYTQENKVYAPDKGANQYRRGLYTFWCRNYPHPGLYLFDAPPRQSCIGDRPRSATPLQALALLNDPTYAEAARVFAYRVLKEAPPAQRFHRAYQLALLRDITSSEEAVLESLYAKQLQRFQKDPATAAAFVSIGQSPAPSDVDVVELAATTAVMRVLLNLRETITRY